METELFNIQNKTFKMVENIVFIKFFYKFYQVTNKKCIKICKN